MANSSCVVFAALVVLVLIAVAFIVPFQQLPAFALALGGLGLIVGIATPRLEQVGEWHGGSVSVSGVSPPTFAQLYTEWQRIRALFNTLLEVPSLTKCHPVRVRLEGWLLHHPTLEDRRRNTEQLIYSLVKGCPDTEQHKEQIRLIMQRVLDSSWAPTSNPIQNIEITPESITYGAFKLNRNQRIDELIYIGGTESTLRAAMRYAGIMASSHQWMTPPPVFDVLWDAGIRNEGFASPFNANILGRPGGHFYSLFIETDAPFGSRGDWLAADLADLLRAPGGWIINPPFTVPIIKLAAARSAELAAKHDVIFITKHADPTCLTQIGYEPLLKIAKGTRTLEMGEHVYGIQGPSGFEYRKGGFDTLIMYLGPRSSAAASALLDSCVAAWPTTSQSPDVQPQPPDVQPQPPDVQPQPPDFQPSKRGIVARKNPTTAARKNPTKSARKKSEPESTHEVDFAISVTT